MDFKNNKKTINIENFYVFNVGQMWSYFKADNFSFIMLCCYMVFEYVRPQSIYPSIDVIPWSQTFLILSLIGLLLKNDGWVSHPVNKWMILFQLVIILSIFNSYWPSTGWDNILYFFGWFVLYFLAISIINTKERLYIFLMIILLASAKLSIFGARTWITRGFGFQDWGIQGPSGYFQNSGELSIQMLIFMPFGYYLLNALSEKLKKWEKALLLIFFITAIMTVLGASSRGAQLALSIQLIIMFSRHIFRFKQIIILIIVGLLIYNLPEQQKQRFTELGTDKTSQQRILFIENGIEMINNHPLLGVGYFNFSQYYVENYSDDLITGSNVSHNIFIQVGSDCGYIGLFIFMMLILHFFITGMKIKKLCSLDPDSNKYILSVSKSLYIGTIGYLIAGQFVTVAYYPFFWVNLTLIVCIHNIILNCRNNDEAIKVK